MCRRSRKGRRPVVVLLVALSCVVICRAHAQSADSVNIEPAVVADSDDASDPNSPESLGLVLAKGPTKLMPDPNCMAWRNRFLVRTQRPSYFDANGKKVESPVLYGYIDRKGTVTSTLTSDRVCEEFRAARAAVGEKSGFGVIDPNGRWVVEPVFDAVRLSRYSNARIGVSIDGKWGLVDPNGSLVVSPRFDHVGWASCGAVPVKQGEKWGFIRADANSLKWIVKPVFDDCYCFTQGLAAVSDGSKWGYINTQGELAIALKWDQAYSFSQGLAVVGRTTDQNELRYGYIDPNGRLAIEAKYQGAYWFKNGLAAVETDRGWGYIDRSGKWVIAPAFDNAGSFHHGVAPAGRSGKWGLIDRKGEWIVKPTWDITGNMRSGLMRVEIDGRWAYVNPKGEYVWKDPDFPDN